jgi:hypothetical protein
VSENKRIREGDKSRKESRENEHFRGKCSVKEEKSLTVWFKEFEGRLCILEKGDIIGTGGLHN